MENSFLIIWDVFNLGLVAFLWWMTLRHYNDLPQRIPIHFSISGKPDRFGDKVFTFLTPVLGLLLYAVFMYITRHPENTNFPVSITENNREAQYQIMKVYLRCLFVLIMLVFMNIQEYTFRYSRDGSAKPRVPVFISVLVILASVLIMLAISNSLK